MKKLLFSMSAFFFVSMMALADNVTSKSALQIAKDAMPRQARSLRLAGKAEGSNPAWYAFNAERQGGGFVIVAGDDRVGQVLGYSEEGTFDLTDMPADMKWWLKGCEEQIELLRQGKAQPARALPERPAVAPLVTSKWGQNAPFNLLTPVIGESHAPTGCMPTAMAQILYYWKSKAGASAIDTYTTESEGIKMEALPATTFNYDIMQDKYESNDESEGALEAAKLMLYCGQSFNVDYQIGGSGASGGSSNFIKDFHFDIHGFDLRSISESRDQWDEAIYAELAAGRPIFMSGVNYIEGHGFVVDGCNGHGLYHINWGWDGRNNGYYLLDAATPGDLNDTTLYGEGYSIGQIATIGLQPTADGISYDDMALSMSSIETDAESYTRSSTGDDFSIGVWAQVNNYYGATLSFNYTAAVFTTDGKLVQTGFVRTIDELQPMWGAEVLHYVDFGAGIESGSYILKVVSRLDGQETWNADFGSYRHYVELTVDGNSMTAVPVTNPFRKSFTINSMEVLGTVKVGKAAHLKFNATNTGTYYINALYAVVDGNIESALGVPFAPGETGDFVLRYTPSTPGTKTIELRTARYNPGTTIWSGTIDVAVPSEPDLTVEAVTVINADAVEKELNDEVWKVQTDVKNNASETYDGVFLGKLYKYDNASGWYILQGTVLSDVVIPAGETGQVRLDFEKITLEVGGLYFAQIQVYKPSAGGYVTLDSTPSYTIVSTPTGIVSLQESPDGQPVPVYSISGQRLGSAEELPGGIYIKGGRKVLKR